MKRFVLALSSIVVGAVVSSCAVGVRHLPTSVTTTSATLNGKVLSTTGGPGSWYIEYGTTPARTQRTPTRAINFTASALYPVSEPISGLTPEATYHYAVCAEDSENPGDAFCSPDQTFVATDKDFVSAHGCWLCTFVEFGLEARSGPSGASPSGQGSLFLRSQLEIFEGQITCLTVTGRKATIGLSGGPIGQHARLFVQDGGSPGAFRDFFGWEQLSAPSTSCPAATDADFPHAPPEFGGGIIGIESGEIVIWDAPASPTS